MSIPKELDIEFLLDKSGSMSTSDCPGGKSRWAAGQETTKALAEYANKFDQDGITVVPFSGNFKVHESVTAEKVGQVFQEHTPMGSTDTAKALGARLDAHFDRKSKGIVKSTCLIVLTDGAPDDQQAVAKTIIDSTQKMGADEELAITFLQVGQDQEASKFLSWLDDELVKAGAKFDIVDTKKLEDVESMEWLIEQAFND